MWRWALTSLLFFTFTVLCCCEEQFVFVAPNLIRTDVPEHIFLQATGVTESISVAIKILDFNSEGTVTQHYLTLSQENNYHMLATIQIPTHNIRREEKQHTYIYLEVRFRTRDGEKYYEKRAIMLSFQSGYIFIQTDKPIYRPEDTVQIRMYASSPTFKASDSNAVSLDIKNPENVVIVQTNKKEPKNGILTSIYRIPKTATEGKWTIIAQFDHLPQNNFNTTFEVKKYVLPAFNVTLTARKPYLDVDDTELYVDITARYLFGETVNGTAYVVYGLKKGKEMMRAPQVKKVTMLPDGGTLRLTVADITQACQVQSGRQQSDCSIRSLVGSYVYIKVSVLTNSGGDLVEVEKSNIKIVNSPYVLALKDMQKYFKPGHPFPITIHVTYHDGSPADKIPLKVSLHDFPLSSSSGTAAVSINMPDDVRTQTITVATNHSRLSADRQATTEVTVDPYRSANPYSPNYLYINARSSGKVKIRELTFEMSITSQQKPRIKGISYLILSKGKILEAKHVAVIDQRITSVTIQVTQEMIPSFRIVAFYLLGREVVSDSIKLDMSQMCVNPPTCATCEGSSLPEYMPGSTLRLKIQGEPSATISLVAVDQALYLLNKKRFTQRHILNEVNSRDTGCTYGSGRNAMGVFSDAGLLFAMKNGPATENRQEVNCPANARRRRSTVLMEHQTQILEQFQEKLHQRCCRDGLRGVLMPYSCEQRSQYITEGPECIKAFLKCCSISKNQVTSWRPDNRGLGRNTGTGFTSDISDADENDALGALGEGEEDEDEEEYDINDITLREQFQDTWLWVDKPVPDNAGLDGRGTLSIESPIPDSITKWSILAVSSSGKTGFCVAEPWTFVSKQKFFVDLKVPFSVARKEQVEISAVVYSYIDYMDEPLDVTVVLQTTRDMCSMAFKRPYKRTVKVWPGTSTVVPYTIVPFVEGKKSIEVAAYTQAGFGDRVKKELNVVVEGVQKTESQIIPLNPSDHQGRQVARTSKPNLRGVVPKSEPVTKIKFLGNMLADSIENAIHDDPLASLIRMPGGCVEQNLAAITFPVIATLYLERTKGWETVGVDRKAKAYDYIEKGYSNQLNYKRSDGSYPPYRAQGPSTWVTAYTVKVFTMIYTVKSTMININNICQSVKFLLQNTQSNYGGFTEANPVNNQYMTGGLRGSDSTATLTAFVMIAFAEVRQANIDCSYMVSDIEPAINKGVSYLKQQLQRSPPPRPYTQAIISYALALLRDGSFDPTSRLLAASSDDGTYWADDDSQFKLEATGYALLALLKMGKMTEAKKPFDYLSRNRNIGGGSGNTQATMVVLHALSEYLIARPPPVKHSLNINLQIPLKNGNLRPVALNFNPATSYQARSYNVPMDAELEVVATGNGMGTLEVVTFYNQLPDEDAKSCEAFDMQVSIQKSAAQPPPGTKNVFELSISVKARGPVDAVSVVLDISLPTGFSVETSDLEQLLNTVERFIDHFYFDEKLSDRGSLIIHMYKVSNTIPRTVTFKLNQQFTVGFLQSSSVTVYEYYKDKGQRCTQLYTPPKDQAQLTMICRNNECQCAQDDCCEIRRGNNDSEGKKRKDFACKTLHHVFKVKVHNVSGDLNIKYDIEIMEVIKLGIESVVLPTERRFFFSHTGCRTKCQLQINSEYLIMGPESDQWTQDSTTNKYTYVLGKDTWVEQWPTATDCSNPEFEDKCQGISKATEDLSLEGCHAKK